MITLLIFIVLVWAFYIGFSRGFLIQGAYTLWSLLALVVATLFYKSLSPHLMLWVPYSNPTQDVTVHFFKSVSIFDLDHIYYASVGFLLIYVLVYVVGRLLGVFLHLIPSIKSLDKPLFDYLAGVLSLLVSAVSLSLCLAPLATVPLQSVQTILSNSLLVRILLDYFPGMTQLIHSLWIH